MPVTLKVTVPTTAPGTIVVAYVTAGGAPTGEVYPVTSYVVVVPFKVAVADRIVIGPFGWLLPIDHVITWSPFVQTVAWPSTA